MLSVAVEVAVLAAVVTDTLPLVAPVGTVSTIVVADVTVNEQEMLLTFTFSAAPTLVPVTVTVAPIDADVFDSDEMDGAAVPDTVIDDFDVAIDQQLADQGADPADLVSVTVTRIHLHADPDLSFLTRLDVYDGAEGMDDVLVADGTEFPEGQPEIGRAHV